MYRNRFNLRKVLAIAIFLTGFSIGDVLAQTSNTDPGVVINGVKWATRNVDKPGTFAATPESTGMFYQWSRRVGWSAKDPMINSNGGTNWDATVPEGVIWKKSNDPSPAGWRIPTLSEIGKLRDENKVNFEWTTINGISGRRFTDKTTGNSIFLPAAGCRYPENGKLNLSNTGSFGGYWTSTQISVGNASAFEFRGSNSMGITVEPYTFGINVRSVAE